MLLLIAIPFLAVAAYCLYVMAINFGTVLDILLSDPLSVASVPQDFWLALLGLFACLIPGVPALAMYLGNRDVAKMNKQTSKERKDADGQQG